MKVERPRHLPDFGAPPLTEVALSIQFQPIAGFGYVDIGLLWQRFRDRFPQVEYHPPLAPGFETFGLQLAASSAFQLNFGLPRTWFIDPAGAEVVQIQSDRFVRNWRKAGADDNYPRFEHIRLRFAEEFKEFGDFLADRGLGAIVPNQCELTYVNSIPTSNGTGDDMPKVFKALASSSSAVLGSPEDFSFTARYVVTSGSGEPVGRIIAQASPALDANSRVIINFMLVGRGSPTSPDLTGALEFMDVARERIVCGFAELTTDEMHRVWKRRS